MPLPGVRFGVIADLHLGHQPPSPHGWVMPEEAGGLLEKAIAALNAEPALDFVLFTGDLVDNGTPAELDDVILRLGRLRAPWYAIPGNHDIAFPPDPALLDRRRFFGRLAQIAPCLAVAYEGAKERGSWTCAVKPGVRLIGLDSNVQGDWSGTLDAVQFTWLADTLAASPEPLVILAIHHPLHPIFGGWKHPTIMGQDWANFFCSNGAEVEALLDSHPQVLVVLTAHDHMSRVDLRGEPPTRMHFASPALGSYPLAYRVIELQPKGEGGSAVRWETLDAAGAELRDRARQRLETSNLAVCFDRDDRGRSDALADGRPHDQAGNCSLPTRFGL